MLITKGYKVNGRYEIIKSIGEGGMANVYLAKDTILEREVAVKILRGDLAFDEKFVRRFQREALSASSLSHPNIVEMYDVGEDDGKYYIVMEFIEGKTLKQLIKKRGFLTVPEVVDIMLQLTDGLAHAHDSYIIHRDIKPQNILILDNGLVKITDFGIAMALNSSELTQTNSVMGSVHYLPPEQASGRGSTIKSDIYSLGIIMYELLTGKLPFKGENAVEIALKQLKDKMPNIRKQMTDIPQSIENIILKATAKNPKNRYNDAREMYQDLKVALDENQINQARHVYKYLEQDLEDTKIMPTIKVGKQKQGDDVVATKIDDQDLSKQNKWIKILVGTFLGLVVLLSVIFILIPFFTNVPDVKIPDVSGKSVENAESILEKLGFKVEVETKKVYSDIIEEGMVVETEPKIGRTVKKGTIITLCESLGTKHLETEDYTGQNYIEVKAILETVHGLNVLIEKSEVENPDDFDPNIIIGQNPEKGSKLVEGDTIILYIPNIVEKYPDMVSEGWTLSDAEAFVEKYELVLSVEYRETDEYAPNMVIEQKRAPGSVIVKGVTLKIVVATEPLVEDEEIIEE
jgi:serine/threonine protein kinase